MRREELEEREWAGDRGEERCLGHLAGGLWGGWRECSQWAGGECGVSGGVWAGGESGVSVGELARDPRPPSGLWLGGRGSDYLEPEALVPG